MTSLRACVLGVLSVVAFGCEFDRSLGDVRDAAGQGGDETGGAGGTSGSASGGKGGASSGGSVSGGVGNGGSTNGGSTNGGSTNGGAGNGGSTNGGASNGGSTSGGTSAGGASEGGTAPNGGTGGDVGCFSPDYPELALLPESGGCPCTEDDVDQCIATGTNSLSLTAMVCENGRWQVVEDGPCEPGPEPWCMIENRVFKQGGEVPLEFLCRLCWFCDGVTHPSCLVIDCTPPECPDNTEQASRCRSCGLRPGGCDVVEHGCFGPCPEGDPCEFGHCSNGTCNAGPCI